MPYNQLSSYSNNSLAGYKSNLAHSLSEDFVGIVLFCLNAAVEVSEANIIFSPLYKDFVFFLGCPEDSLSPVHIKMYLSVDHYVSYFLATYVPDYNDSNL